MNARRIAALLAVVLAIASFGCKKEGDKAETASTTAPSTTAPAMERIPGPDIPFEVAQPQAGHPVFAQFAWEEFIALNWPSKMNGAVPVRGVPDRDLWLGDALDRPRVWETWKTDWELFGFGGPNPPQPSAWSEWSTPGLTPCPGMTIAPGQKVLTTQGTTASKMRGLNQALAGPVIDQRRNYARYEIRLNQNEYDTITNEDNKWYIAANLPAVITLDSSTPGKYGAIELKAAWRELVDADDRSRFYNVAAWKLDPGTTKCVETRVGLVGFHIAHKTAPFKQWVWSTFEHVDNVPANPPGSPDPNVKYSFNNGTTTPASPNGFDKRPTALVVGAPLPPIEDVARNPIQVTRFERTPDQIGEANQKFRNAKPVVGTVWANYVLVANQWPTDTTSTGDKYPEGAGLPFPDVRVANTTMETYFQNKPLTSSANSCMSCHFVTANVGRDYSYLFADAWVKPASGRALQAQPLPPELRALQELIRAEQ